MLQQRNLIQRNRATLAVKRQEYRQTDRNFCNRAAIATEVNTQLSMLL